VTDIEAEWNGWRERLERTAGENGCGERLGSQWGLGELKFSTNM